MGGNITSHNDIRRAPLYLHTTGSGLELVAPREGAEGGSLPVAPSGWLSAFPADSACHHPPGAPARLQPLNFPFPGLSRLAPGEGAPLPLPGAPVCSPDCQGTMPIAWRAGLGTITIYLPPPSSEYRSRCSRKGPGEDHLTRRCGDSAGRMGREGRLWNLPAGGACRRKRRSSCLSG